MWNWKVFLIFIFSEIRHRREDKPEDLSEAELEKEIDICLTETDTIWLLDLPSVCVSNENEDAPRIIESNARYQEVMKTIETAFAIYGNLFNQICQK